MQTWTKDIGTVTLSFGNLYVTASDGQGYNWATRGGQSWPCSEIRYLDRVCAEIDTRNGDLLDLSVQGGENDIPGDELTAWIDDCLGDTPFAHLARSVTPA